MAGKSRKLTVTLSPKALAALDLIWDWNAKAYSINHAHRYIAFLKEQTQRLEDEFFAGKAVRKHPNLCYITIKLRRKGNGHVAVYEFVGDDILVLNYFHTAQDWRTKLSCRTRRRRNRWMWRRATASASPGRMI